LKSSRAKMNFLHPRARRRGHIGFITLSSVIGIY